MAKALACVALAALLGAANSQSVSFYTNGECKDPATATQDVSGCKDLTDIIGTAVGAGPALSALVKITGQISCASDAKTATLSFFGSISLAVFAGVATSAEKCPSGNGQWSSSSPNFYNSPAVEVNKCATIPIKFGDTDYSMGVKFTCPPPSALSAGAIVGIIIGVIVLIALVGVGIAAATGKLKCGVSQPKGVVSPQGNGPVILAPQGQGQVMMVPQGGQQMVMAPQGGQQMVMIPQGGQQMVMIPQGGMAPQMQMAPQMVPQGSGMVMRATGPPPV